MTKHYIFILMCFLLFTNCNKGFDNAINTSEESIINGNDFELIKKVDCTDLNKDAEIFIVQSVPVLIRNFTKEQFEASLVNEVNTYLDDGMNFQIKIHIIFSLNESACVYKLFSQEDISPNMLDSLSKIFTDKIKFNPGKQVSREVVAQGETILNLQNGHISSIKHNNYEFN